MNMTAEKQAENEEDGTLSEEEQRIQAEETMQLFGKGLQSNFDKQVGLKEQLEQRWIDDLRHYNGRYDKETEAKMNAADATGAGKKNTSRVFVNLTRAKSNTAESKWSDLVLPTDDRNWGLKPTPVPEIVKQLEDDSDLIMPNGDTAVEPETEEPYKKSDQAKEIIKEAKKAAELMQEEIDDQLTEANYNAACRSVIHDSVVMGTGIIKGPMVEKRAKRAWVDDGQGNWGLSSNADYKPTAAHVDPWNFFPDMSATKWKDAEFCFERHLLTRKQLRLLSKQPGYMKDQIRNLLQQSPNISQSKLNYLNELREMNGITQIQGDNRYEVLEYHGPIEKNDLVACGCRGVNEDDPLEEFDGTVWFCMGTVIKVGLNHLDSDDLPYSVLNWEKDETSIFGFGVPYRMRAPQRVMNASWRMVLDNAGLSTGPQVLINKHMVEPANGSWDLTPRKVWWITSKDPKIRADYAMQTFAIDSNQQELTNIFEMAHRLADEETSVPQQQMGGGQPGDQQQPAMLKTLGGSALWMSANNIMMRRAVKNFDDDLTDPFITRFYDWNMQFNKRSDVKGDYSIDVRGTSVLLVREMQARNMQEFIASALAIPGGADELKPRGVLKSMAKGQQINIDEVMRTDAEYESAKTEAENNPPPPDPEMMKLQMQERIAKEETNRKVLELQGAERTALITQQTELAKLVATKEIDLEKIRSELGIKKYEKDVDTKLFFEELSIKMREGITANYGLSSDQCIVGRQGFIAPYLPINNVLEYAND